VGLEPADEKKKKHLPASFVGEGEGEKTWRVFFEREKGERWCT